METEDYCIVVEAKADNLSLAEEEVQFYMLHNKINTDIIGIAVSGQSEKSLNVSYFLKYVGEEQAVKFSGSDKLIDLASIRKQYLRLKQGGSISTEALITVLKDLNKRFHSNGKIRDTERSLFFSGLMIALKNSNFRRTYKSIQPPSNQELASIKAAVPEAHNLNKAILDAITEELAGKINSLSKEFSWRDKFSFIRNIDFALDEYKKILGIIERKIFYPFQNEEKQDILGRAYKIFLSRAGKVDNKNIILTPDHIKTLMVKLARLSVNDVVLDTCTGSGGFLMEAMETMIQLADGDENNNPVKFTLQALKYLEHDGRLVVIMPTPALSHNKNGLTEKILSLAKLEYVIKMPVKLFSEQKRTVNTSIFGFTKTPHNHEDEVMFYDLDDDGFVSIQHKGRVDRNGTWPDIQAGIIEAVFNMKEIPSVCEKRKIYRDGILNPSGIRAGRSSSYKMVKISELFKIEKGTLASESNTEGDYPFITASEEWKTHTEYSHDTEAIVYAVSASGSLGRSHYVNGKFIASNLCLVLLNRNNPEYPLDMQFYSYYFEAVRKQIISDLAEGTSKLTISPDLFAEYYIDYVPYNKQTDFVNIEIKELTRLKKEYRQAKIKISRTISELL